MTTASRSDSMWAGGLVTGGHTASRSDSVGGGRATGGRSASRSDSIWGGGAGQRYWLGVVSREHVQRGVELGIAQVNHGKRTPLERMRPGDGFLYYSPREGMRTGAPIRSFTAIGTIADAPVWQADPQDGGCFQPWRRAVHYRTDARAIPIDELRGELDLTSAPNWGMVLRRGLVELTAHDFAVIAQAMIDEPQAREAYE